MKIYMSKNRPDTQIHLPESLDDLKKIAKEHGLLVDVKLLLNGCMSSKEIGYYETAKKPWSIYHGIDGHEDEYTDKTLAEQTNVVNGINNKALIVCFPKGTKCGCLPKSRKKV